MEKIMPSAIPADAVAPHRTLISIAVATGLTIGLVPYLVFIRHIGWTAA